MSEKRKYYITTPIYYPSAKLHIGHTYCTTIADSLARFHRLRGDDVFFLTGSDEHGQKIQRAAEAKGVKPIEQLVNDRTLCPTRAIFDAFGASVEWDGAIKQVTGKK